MSEFSRVYDLRTLSAAPQGLTASAEECAALAARFGLVKVERFAATVTLTAEGPAVRAIGRLKAVIVQSCAVSGDDLPVTIDEPIALRFIPEAEPNSPDEEIELGADELDEIVMDGAQFDLGEALAQGLALAIDPYATGPGADEARRKAGIVSEGESGPFAALKGLLKE